MTDASGLPPSVIRPLLRVRQVRAFTDDPVDPSAVDAIVDAARWSGSSRNSQPWRFIIVRQPETLRRLAEAGLPQTRAVGSAAGAVAISMAQESGAAVSHAYDEGRAAERMLVAASLLGLGAGISWVRSEARPLVGELLGLPGDRFVRTLVAIGHPTEAAREPKSAPGTARLPRTETVFYERYGDDGEGAASAG